MRLLVPLAAAALAIPAVVSAQIPAAEFAQRRAALVAQLDDGVLVARGAEEPPRDYDSFNQSPNFLYLTGYREPGAALLLTKRGTDVHWTLFVLPKNPAAEVWTGRRNGPQEAAAFEGIPARSAEEFDAAVDSALKGATKAWIVADIAEGGDTLNRDDAFLTKLRAKFPQVTFQGANQLLSRQRGTKSPAELELLRKAVAISTDAHREAMRATEPGMNEFEIQALVEYTFRRNGADRPAYASIVGSGPNSTTLHYNHDDRFVNPGDVIVMDVAATYRGYAADITRTFPVSGSFTPAQREVYQIVRDAQAAAERQVKIGNQAKLLGDSARAVIAAGLTRLGLIEAPNAMYDCGSEAQPRQCPQVSLYYMHGLGHGIGLEVHDPDQFYFSGTIQPGSAFTIEPGIYVRGNLLDILPHTPKNATLAQRIGATVKKYADVGVRIEDDYVVTDQGMEWVSCGLPREIDEVEALMKEPYQGPAKRDATKVDWYRVGDGTKNGDASAKVAPTKGCGPRM